MCKADALKWNADVSCRLAALHFGNQVAKGFGLLCQIGHRAGSGIHGVGGLVARSLTSTMDLLISSLVADCSSLAVAMART